MQIIQVEFFFSRIIPVKLLKKYLVGLYFAKGQLLRNFLVKL